DDSQGEACPTVSGLEAEQDKANIIKTCTLLSESTLRVTSLAADEGKDEPASPLVDDSQGEACPTVFGLEAEQDKENIIKTSTLLSESTLRVTSLAADEGSMQQKLNELMDLYTRLQRQQTEMASKITAQDLEIASLKARIKMLEDRGGGGDDPSGEDASIKGRSLETGEETCIERSTDKGSNDIDKMVNVLTSLDAASILTSRDQVSVPPASEVATSQKKKKLQEQMDVQIAREMEEQLAREDQRIDEQIARDAKIARIHAEEELQRLIDGLDRNNESCQVPVGEVLEEDLKEMMQLVPVKEVYVEALQVKHTLIDWEIHTEGQRSYWKIIRLGGSTASYQFFVNMLKHFDREDLNQLWALVKETLNIKQATSDKEKELWVELKRLYEPDVEDQLWTQTQALMHDPVEWRLYDSCGLHYVLSRDQEIFMLVEKEYPLRKGLAIVMISNKQKTKTTLKWLVT
nr:hypothetical protein [Tanacetum cinerariifolium]